MRTSRFVRAGLVSSILVAASMVGVHAQSSSPAPTTEPVETPMAVHDGPLVPGTYSITPFVGAEWDPCPATFAVASPPPCPDPGVDDDLRFTFEVPDGWAGIGGTLWRADMGNSPPGGAGILFGRGGSLYSGACPTEAGPDIPVGPSVDDFVSALVDHPQLNVTEPVDVTLAGYSGKYLELQAPSEVTDCHYFVWEPGIYAQGPDHLWHIWVLDVNGVRVVLRADTYPGTTAEVRAQIDAIMQSLRIDSAPATP